MLSLNKIISLLTKNYFTFLKVYSIYDNNKERYKFIQCVSPDNIIFLISIPDKYTINIINGITTIYIKETEHAEVDNKKILFVQSFLNSSDKTNNDIFDYGIVLLEQNKYINVLYNTNDTSIKKYLFIDSEKHRKESVSKTKIDMFQEQYDILTGEKNEEVKNLQDLDINKEIHPEEITFDDDTHSVSELAYIPEVEYRYKNQKSNISFDKFTCETEDVYIVVDLKTFYTNIANIASRINLISNRIDESFTKSIHLKVEMIENMTNEIIKTVKDKVKNVENIVRTRDEELLKLNTILYKIKDVCEKKKQRLQPNNSSDTSHESKKSTLQNQITDLYADYSTEKKQKRIQIEELLVNIKETLEEILTLCSYDYGYGYENENGHEKDGV